MPDTRLKSKKTPLSSDRQSTGATDKLSEEGRDILMIITDKLEAAIENIVGRQFERLEHSVQQLVSRIELRDVKIDELDKKIEVLEQRMSNMNKSNNEIKEQLEDLETNKRLNTAIISGKGVPVVLTGEDVRSVVKDVMKRHVNYELAPDSVTAAYRVGKKPINQAPDKRSILVEFRRKDIRDDLMRSIKMSKPDKIFISENLTPTRSAILFALRQARRRFPEKLMFCGSIGGRVYIWERAPGMTGKNTKIFINSMSTLKQFCERSLNVDPSELLNGTPLI